MKRLNLFALGLLAFLLAFPQGARAASFLSTVADQTFYVGTPVSITLPRIDPDSGVGQGCSILQHGSTIYTLTPSLPQGLSFAGGDGSYSSTTLVLSGTPAQTSATTQYTYQGEDFGCYATATTTFNITVEAAQSTCSSQSGTDLQADCAVLETLYDDTGGANWADSTNWKSANSLDTWHGVDTENGRVSSINLARNQLTGTIPSDLNNLAGLVTLDLGVNSLSGGIPDLSSLDSLRDLYLLHNKLSGSIPDLSGLDKLTQIVLEGNSLDGTIASAGLDSMDSAVWVYLADNRLSGTIPDLSSNEFLSKLYLQGNRLSGTLADLASTSAGLGSLNEINLSDNKLSGTIPDLSEIRSMRILYVANNKLSGTLANLSTIGTDSGPYFRGILGLDLGGNNLSGVLPGLGFFNSSFPGAHTLSLHGNNLSGALPDLSSFTNLSLVDFAENDFTGEMGDLGGSSGDLSVFGRLHILDVSGNRLTGEIPESSKLPRSVDYFQFNDNRLSGSVPDLSGLTRLKALGLWGNPDLDLMNITLPSGVNKSVIDWAALWTLHYKNGGSGWTNRSSWISPVNPLGQWHGVTTDGSGQVTGLNLRYNNLRGGISSSIAALGKLATLDLSCNSSLSGELPLALKDIDTLTSVNICSTGMTVTSDQSFTTWKNGITFTDGTCTCPQSVSQQSLPPVSQVSQPPDEKDGLGQGGGGAEDIQSPDPASPTIDPGDIEAGGGCALVSGAVGERPAAAVLGLFLAASALLAVSCVGRRGRGRIQGDRSAVGAGS